MSPKVFISYSHDSEEHSTRVLGLSDRLRADGIETTIDQYVEGAPVQGWARWMLDQLDNANHVLVICSETYYRRFRGHEVPGKGQGADWEGALITQEIYDERSRTLKFIPVCFNDGDISHIPEPLRGWTRYVVDSEQGYMALYDFLTGVAGVDAHPLGPLKPRERKKGSPATYESKDTDSLGRVLTETQEELRGGLLRRFQSTLKQIDVLSDYKELHDALHELRVNWLPVVRREVDSLPDAKRALQNLRTYEREMRSHIDILNTTRNQNRIPKDELTWIEELEAARQRFKNEVWLSEPNVGVLDEELQSIANVLDTEPTTINSKLLIAVGALRLFELKDTVQLVLDKFGDKAPERVIQQFRQAIADLTSMDVDLNRLIREHDLWQVNENKREMMRQSTGDRNKLRSLKQTWDQAKSKVSPLYTDKSEEWAADLKKLEQGLDEAIKAAIVLSAASPTPSEDDWTAAMTNVVDSFDFYDGDAKRRFLQVDKLIKEKCKSLIAIRARMTPDSEVQN